MKICVTGANGFIGQALCRRLIRDDYSVVGTVRKGKTSQAPSGALAVEIDDINKSTRWGRALSDADIVVHTAARVHTKDHPASEPLAAYRAVNVFGTENLARQAAESGVKRFVYISSIKVNGEESWRPYTEADRPAPVDSYGISKMEAERRLRIVSSDTKMAVIILRPPLVYGPNVKANFLKLLKTIDRGTPLPFASVKNQRNLIFVKNLVHAILVCIRHPGASDRTFLVSDREAVSTPELIGSIAALMHKPSRLFSVPDLLLHIGGRLAGKGPVMDRLVGSLTIDTSKITEDLDWHPPFSLTEGLEKTVAWFQGAKRLNQ